ncbi:MAG: hypothetical protein SF187_16515 [Deltaproteobacteria bacterium]|nr:hypothetical protein [Deltaproteobacteria bacterium]
MDANHKNKKRNLATYLMVVSLSAVVTAAFLKHDAFAGPDPAPLPGAGAVAPVELMPLPGPSDTKRKTEVAPPKSTVTKAEDVVPLPPDVPCGGESAAFCPDLEGQPLYRCLASHVEDLGRLCLLGLRPYAIAWFKKACAPDARQFCLGAKGAELLACLVEEQPNLTMACKAIVELAPAARGKTTGVAAEMPAVKTAVSQ